MDRYSELCADANPLRYGGTYYRENDNGDLELFEIQPVVEYVGTTEAQDVGVPFWSRESCFDDSGLRRIHADRGVLRCMDAESLADKAFDDLALADRLTLAYAGHFDGGWTEEGPSGWSADLPLKALGIAKADGTDADREFIDDVFDGEAPSTYTDTESE